jgi:hypothetical protein
MMRLLIILCLAFAGCTTNTGPTLPAPIAIGLEKTPSK